MKKFKVNATHFEELLQKEIEADSAFEARQKYIELWEEGMIEVNENQIGNFLIEEVI